MATADNDKKNAVANIYERKDNEAAQNGSTAVPASAGTGTTDLNNSVTEAINDTEDHIQAVFIRKLPALNEKDFMTHFMTQTEKLSMLCLCMFEKTSCRACNRPCNDAWLFQVITSGRHAKQSLQDLQDTGAKCSSHQYRIPAIPYTFCQKVWLYLRMLYRHTFNHCKSGVTSARQILQVDHGLNGRISNNYKATARDAVFGYIEAVASLDGHNHFLFICEVQMDRLRMHELTLVM